MNSNYIERKEKEGKRLYKKYYGSVFSKLTGAERAELFNNGYGIWDYEKKKGYHECTLDFDCGLSVAIGIEWHELEDELIIIEGTRLYDSQIGIIE